MAQEASIHLTTARLVSRKTSNETICVNVAAACLHCFDRSVPVVRRTSPVLVGLAARARWRHTVHRLLDLVVDHSGSEATMAHSHLRRMRSRNVRTGIVSVVRGPNLVTEFPADNGRRGVAGGKFRLARFSSLFDWWFGRMDAGMEFAQARSMETHASRRIDGSRQFFNFTIALMRRVACTYTPSRREQTAQQAMRGGWSLPHPSIRSFFLVVPLDVLPKQVLTIIISVGSPNNGVDVIA